MNITTKLNDGRTMTSERCLTDTFSIGGKSIKESIWFHSIDNVNQNPYYLHKRGLINESKKNELLNLK